MSRGKEGGREGGRREDEGGYMCFLLFVCPVRASVIHEGGGGNSWVVELRALRFGGGRVDTNPKKRKSNQ